MPRVDTSAITVLVENTACMGSGRGIWAEHGLSYWLEVGDKHVVFDTGASGVVMAHNAPLLGADLSKADAIILSHGHLDHVGGLETLMKLAKDAPIYMHPLAPRPKFTGAPEHMHRSDTPFFVGEKFREGTRKVIESSAPTEIVPGVWMTGEVPRTNDFETTGGPFFLEQERVHPDTLPDDQSLFIPTETGTVVITGCAHAGIINTLDYIKKLTNNAPIRFVIGGTHLESASLERMERTFAELKRLGVSEIHPCHCTGMMQSVRLCDSVGNKSQPAYAGFKIAF